MLHQLHESIDLVVHGCSKRLRLGGLLGLGDGSDGVASEDVVHCTAILRRPARETFHNILRLHLAQPLKLLTQHLCLGEGVSFNTPHVFNELFLHARVCVRV